jgi:hypothetical protein
MFNCALALLISKRLREAGGSGSGLLPWRRRDPPPPATHFSEMVSVPSSRKRVSVLCKLRQRKSVHWLNWWNDGSALLYVACTFANFLQRQQEQCRYYTAMNMRYTEHLIPYTYFYIQNCLYYSDIHSRSWTCREKSPLHCPALRRTEPIFNFIHSGPSH